MAGIAEYAFAVALTVLLAGFGAILVYLWATRDRDAPTTPTPPRKTLKNSANRVVVNDEAKLVHREREEAKKHRLGT